MSSTAAKVHLTNPWYTLHFQGITYFFKVWLEITLTSSRSALLVQGMP